MLFRSRNRQSSRLNCSIHHRVSAVCRETMHPNRQSPQSCDGKPPAHPTQRKPSVTPGWQSAFLCQTCTLPAFICCKRRCWKALYGPNGPILAAFCRIMAQKTPENCWANPPKPTNNASKSPENGFWGHFGPFGSHFYPFYIDFQRNKK